MLLIELQDQKLLFLCANLSHDEIFEESILI